VFKHNKLAVYEFGIVRQVKIELKKTHHGAINYRFTKF